MFENVTANHIEEAIIHLNDSGIPARQKSRIYATQVNGKEYPPKYLITVAYRLANDGQLPSDFNTYQAQAKLEELGFKTRVLNEPPFFVANDFDLLKELSGEHKDGSNARHTQVYEGLKNTYAKIEFWARRIQEEMFPDGKIDLLKKPTNQGNVFSEYQWAKIYPTQSAPIELAYTVSIETEDKFVVKIDTATLLDHDPKRQEYFRYRGEWNNSPIVNIHDASEIIPLGWEKLIDLSTNAIKRLLPHYDRLLKILLPETHFKKVNEMHALNTILFGPPGTGKTYTTINKAVAIASPTFDFTTKNRVEIKTEYKRLFEIGRIAFISFHQSLSYEDFIEGIKPKTLDEKVVYEIEDGLFKSFCNKARFINGNFEEIIEKFKTDISEADGKKPLTISAQTTSFDIIYRGTNVFYVQPHNSTKQNPWYPINIDNILKAFETDSFTNIYNPTYAREVLTYLKKSYGLVKGNSLKNTVKENYVLIIDEINRGNVSQIFGELITLIEPDKREGCAEELQVQLPYSKQLFSVPDNVFIVGTMNTADRSVEALDTALRRRFSFEFMPPNSSVFIKDGNEVKVGGYTLRQILDTINERIRYLLDEDHQIGHSYFYDVSDENGLNRVFKNKIIPLLKEFFYNDHGKLRLILGDGFVGKKKDFPKFAAADEDDFLTDKVSYTIKVIDENFNTQEALKKLINA